MSRLLVLAMLALLLTGFSVRTQAKGSACWYSQDEILLVKHPNCLVHQAGHNLRVTSAQLRQLPFEGKYATIFSKEYGWMYVDHHGVVVADHVMVMDNGADYIEHGFVRFTRNGKCGYASLGKDPRHGVNLQNFESALLESVVIRRFDGADTWKFLD